MNISQNIPNNNPSNLLEMAQQLHQFVEQSAEEGVSLYEAEKSILATVLQMGKLAVDHLLELQGDGDLGPTVQTEEDQTLQRSAHPISRALRTVFGEHSFSQYIYQPGPKQKVALRPLDARLQLSDRKYSHLLEEFSQYFCVEQAFRPSADALKKVLGQRLSVSTLEATNQRLGEQAEVFLDNLPTPPADQEGELLVATADGKGVPLIRESEPTPVHGSRPPRPGNRRMATVVGVHSVDRYRRTPEDLLAALFRDAATKETVSSEDATSRPTPCHKRLASFFSILDEEEPLRIRGDVRAWTWAASQIDDRRQSGQPLIRLCDGQASLWSTSDTCLGLDTEDAAISEGQASTREVVDILDIIHVAAYVWLVARAFFGNAEKAVETFVRDRLLRILQGQISGVISGIRRMVTQRQLRGDKKKQVLTACNYWEKHQHRMRYDFYLAEGYPIASGVIEGACRHLVKDRMERTGMRWVEENAGSMLFVRALKVTELWDEFQVYRQKHERERLHPHRHLIKDYVPTIERLAA